MTRAKIFAIGLLLTATASNSWSLKLNGEQARQSLIFADSALECGIYYEYTAGGLAKNPKVDTEVVHRISENSQTLLHTADLLYQAAGISTADKRKQFMYRARVIIKERQADPKSIEQLIYDFGEKCKLLMATYSYRIKTIAAKPNSI